MPRFAVARGRSNLLEIWQAGTLFYSEKELDAIKEALVNFQKKKHRKAAVMVYLTYSSGQFFVKICFFYDAPTSFGAFDDFLAIPTTEGNVSTISFSDFVQSLGPQFATSNFRVFFEGAPVTRYSWAVFDAFANQVKLWGPRLYAQDQNVSLSSVLEPFDKGLFSHGSESAYPPDRSQVVFPSALSLLWTNASLDDTMALALRNISDTIRSVALADGQNVSHAAKYVNYALFGTPLGEMYGENVKRLREIRAEIDPEDVMGLAGGWKF